MKWILIIIIYAVDPATDMTTATLAVDPLATFGNQTACEAAMEPLRGYGRLPVCIHGEPLP